MSVVKMQKIRIIGLKEDKDAFIKHLQASEIIHLKNFEEKALDDYFSGYISDGGQRRIAEELSHIESTIFFLEQFDENKPLVENFFPALVKVDEKEISKTALEFDYKKIIKDVGDTRDRIAKIDEQIASINSDIALLLPFKDLSWEPCEAKETESTNSLFLKGSKGKITELDGGLSEICLNYTETISSDADFIYILLIYWKEKTEDTLSIIKDTGFEIINLCAFSEKPAEAINSLRKEIEALNREKEEFLNKIRQTLKEQDKFKIVHDWFLFKLQREKAKEQLYESQSVFLLQGWVRKDQIDAAEKIIKDKFPATHIENILSDEGEIPPIAVKNPSIIRPFQSVTNLFGLPHFGEVDPAGLIAPFFFVFFGLCIADVGYGIILIALSLLAMRKIVAGKGARQFFCLFILGGFSAILWGIVTGGWFGIDVAKLPQLLQKPILFSPLENLMTFFVLALSLGLIQVLFGMGVEMYEQLREKNFAIAFADQLSYIIILPGIILWVASRGNLSLIQFNRLGLLMMIFGTAIMVAASLFKGKNPIWELITSILMFFWKAKDFLGNVLSYSRLMALGLAGGVIAFVVNTFAMMALQIPYLGILVALLVIVIGHMANLVINTLGAFIHTMRLQFVEFFSYFFQGGGEAFQPLSKESRYIISKS
jgi:V/A-type H+-transporting ATPase subunit I